MFNSDITITNEKIEVTEQMMFNEKLSRFKTTCKLGIPMPDGGVIWKNAFEITLSEFDLIEEYFLKIKEKQHAKI